MPSQRSLPRASACWRSGGSVFHCEPNCDSTRCWSGDRLDQPTPVDGAATGAAGGGGGCCAKDGTLAAVIATTPVRLHQHERQFLFILMSSRAVRRVRCWRRTRRRGRRSGGGGFRPGLCEIFRVHIGEPVDAAEKFEEAGIGRLGRLGGVVGASNGAAEQQRGQHFWYPRAKPHHPELWTLPSVWSAAHS